MDRQRVGRVVEVTEGVDAFDPFTRHLEQNDPLETGHSLLANGLPTTRRPQMSNTTFGSVRTTVLGLAAAFTTAAEAAGTPPKSMLLESSFIEDIGASEHIVYAAKLRILGQRIPAAACYQHAGIEKEASAELLQKSVYEFNRIIEGLKYGDAELGLMKAETDRKVLEDIKQVYDVWNPLHAKIDEVMARGSTDDDILYFAAQAYPMGKITNHLVSVISGEYSNPAELLQADAMKLDIAGRQPMLAYTISKDVCLIMAGLDVEKSMEEMAEARQLFSASAQALRHGMPEVGILPTKNQAILDGLDQVIAEWGTVQPILDLLSNGDTATVEQEAQVFFTMSKIAGIMDDVEMMYNQDAKLKL